ncbi:MAG: acetylxylan esterase [Bacillota bacterium]
MIDELLKNLKLPNLMVLNNGELLDDPKRWVQRRSEIIELLSNEVYGFSPQPPKEVVATLREVDEIAFAGKATHSKIDLGFETPKGHFSFPINLIVPKNVSKVPVFIHISFRPDIPDIFFPAEEIIDNGFAVASFYYEDIVEDCNPDFSRGLPAMYSEKENQKRSPNSWGKIAMWAWAAQRVADYLVTIDQIDREKIMVAGHSRLGKTALWCAAQDERFAVGISNNSGCTGAAFARGTKRETIKEIVRVFEFWFCENYKKYVDNEANMPFDQHFLLAAIAPRAVYVSSAEEDLWADPLSEFLCCNAASEAFQLLGKPGLVTPDQIPLPDTNLLDGNIGYHIRSGKHYLSRYDWQQFMKFAKMR